MDILSRIADILIPRYCLGCKREGQYICEKCEIFLSEAPNNIKNLFTVWEYEGIVEKAIIKIKYDKMYHIIDELVEKALGKMEINLHEDTYITYVPMHKKALRTRGFNQSELIAQQLGKWLTLGKQQPKLLQVGSLLAKTKDNPSQVGLNPQKRVENVKDVFIFCGDFAPANVLLVDDVYTTGATMNACARALHKAGVKNILFFALARKFNV